MRLAALVLAATSLAAAASVAHADVWMWKDSAGEAHYSDRPIEGAVLVKTTTQHAATGGGGGDTGAARRDTPKLHAAPTSPDPAEAARLQSAAKSVQEDLAKKQDEQCTKAKDAYDKAIGSRRLYKEGADGERQYMSDAEADDYRVKARADVDAFCGKSSSP